MRFLAPANDVASSFPGLHIRRPADIPAVVSRWTKVARKGLSVIAAATDPTHPRERTLCRSSGVLDRPVEVSAPASNERLESSKAASGPGPEVPGEAELMHSTWEHRAWVGSAIALLSATLATGLLEVHSGQDMAAVLAALVAAYYVSDFLTGVYHWSVDNYGDGSTPFVGSQIAAFQGHHQRPWTITEREFCNNVHKVFKPAAPFAALCLMGAGHMPAWLDTFLASASFLMCMSQQFHAWAHMKKSELPAAVVALQDAGVLVSRRMHGAHHRAPFEGNYCIVSGACNAALDANGSEAGFFRRLERYFAARTGVEPRCWHPPQYEVEEEPA